jgi:hypothetical protein
VDAPKVAEGLRRSEVDELGLSCTADAHVRRLHFFEGAGAVLSSRTLELKGAYLTQDRRDRVREAVDVVACVPLLEGGRT